MVGMVVVNDAGVMVVVAVVVVMVGVVAVPVRVGPDVAVVGWKGC